MKKVIILPLILLCSCTPTLNNSILSQTSSFTSQESIGNSSNESYSSSIESSTNLERIFYKDFSNYQDDTFSFFQEGYSTVNSKFGDNYLNLIDKDGYIRTCDISNLSNDLTFNITAHVTNLHSLNQTAINQTFAYKVETINYYLDEDGFSQYDVIDTYSFSYTLKEDDINNKSIPNIPPYSSDFSEDPISFKLNGEGANKILITLTSKIEFIVDSKDAGCNFSIHSLEILK